MPQEQHYQMMLQLTFDFKDQDLTTDKEEVKITADLTGRLYQTNNKLSK